MIGPGFTRRSMRPFTILFFLTAVSAVNLAEIGYQRNHGRTGYVQEVRIQVLDKNNSGVAAADIRLFSPTSPTIMATTDSSGSAKLSGVSAGPYTLVVNIGGKEIHRDQFEIRTSDRSAGSAIRVIVRTGRPKTGVVSLKELKAPQNAKKQYIAAVDLIRKRELEMALNRLNAALAAYPEYARAYNARGVVFGMMNRGEESEANFRIAIQIDPDLAEPHFNLGKLLLESGKVSEARQELQTTVDLQNDHLPAIESLVDLMLAIHDETSALSLVHSLDLRGLEHPSTLHLKLGAVLEKQLMFGLAAEQYTIVLKHKPSESDRQAAELGKGRSENR